MNAPGMGVALGIRRARVVMVLAALGGAWSMPAEAGEALAGGSYRLVGGPISGGGVASGGGFTLNAGVGDVAAGVALGGTFELSSGLHSVMVTVGDVSLRIEDLGDGRVAIEWPVSAVGYVLESVPALGESVLWQVVTPGPPGNSLVTTVADAAQQFFRLRKP